jgi:hypothetical protein
MQATLFLITSWWDKENYQSDYLDVESHGYDLHDTGICGYNNIECLNHEDLTKDINQSIELLNSHIAFAYPFYDYTTDAIDVLKELNFDIAFVGGNQKATRDNDFYLIPRYTIYDTTTIDEFIQMVN